ncbi:MAG: shikimate dehydrogenase [Actinomycetota bacterium]
MIPISGATLTVGVIGDPVRHSLSPTLHNAAFDALGVDARSLAFPVAAGSAVDAVAAMRTLGIRGLSVTMPHKEAVIAAADLTTDAVDALGAANCLVNDDGVVTAHNTDGDGLVRSVEIETGATIAGARVVVLGAGGAARSVIEALGRSGASEITVVNRTPERAEAAAAVGGDPARVGAVDAIEHADLVVNATSVGMDGAALPSPVGAFGAGQVVVDLIYRPLRTPWLDAAGSAGATAVNGVGMLLHQAAIQLEHWTGQDAPVDAMRASVAGAIGGPLDATSEQDPA